MKYEVKLNDLRTDTDDAGISYPVTAQEFLRAEPGVYRGNCEDGYVVLESGKILTPCGVGRFYDSETKSEYREIFIGDVTVYYDTNDAAAIEFESADSYRAGKFIHVPN